MHATLETTSKPNKLQQAEAAFAQLIAEASRRGFYGTAGLTLSIQDGTIQHVRVAMERMIVTLQPSEAGFDAGSGGS
jgi:hypothetical protein